MPSESLNYAESPSSWSANKRPHVNATMQDPLVHHGHHFGRVVHAFCTIQTLITNGIVILTELDGENLELPTVQKRKEFAAFRLEARIMQSSEDEGSNGARADDTKGMKTAIIDWIPPKGQSLNPYILRNMKSGRGYNHEHIGALLCPAGLNWVNSKSKLISGQIQPAGDQWPVFLYTNYTYDTKDPWNGLLHSGLLVSTHFALTSAQVFSHTDHVTDSEQFYDSVLELLDDPEEKEEVDQFITWQIFPLYADAERLSLKNSALAQIRQNCKGGGNKP
ncbi:hypothetical protein V8E55_009526 [Tylopilus felleus]